MRKLPKNAIEWRLGEKIAREANTCKTDQACYEVVEHNYEPPLYIRWLSKFPILGQQEENDINRLYQYLKEYVDKAFYVRRTNQSIRVLEDFAENLKKSINSDTELSIEDKNILNQYITKNHEDIKRKSNEIFLAIGELESNINTSIQPNIAVTKPQFDSNKSKAIELIDSYIPIFFEYKNYPMVVPEKSLAPKSVENIQIYRGQSDQAKRLQNKVNAIIDSISEKYIQNLNNQKKNIQDIESQVKPVSWIERLHIKWTAQRLKSLSELSNAKAEQEAVIETQ